MGEPLGDGEAETDPGRPVALVRPLEGLEQSGPVVLGDPRPLVGDEQLHLPVWALDGADPDRPALRGLDCESVLDDVDERPLQQGCVDLDEWQGLVNCDVDGGRGPHRSDVLQCRCDHLLERDVPSDHLQASRLDPAHVEELPDHTVESVRLTVDGLQEAPGLLGAEGHVGREETRDGGLDPGQRGPEIVRHRAEDARSQRLGPRQRLADRSLAAEAFGGDGDGQLLGHGSSHAEFVG